MNNALHAIEQARAAGMVLSVNGDKLNIKGKQSPDLDRIIQMIKPIKSDVIEALQQQAKIGSWNADKVTPITDVKVLTPEPVAQPEPVAPQWDLFTPTIAGDDTPQKVAPVKLDVATSDLSLFVGQVVSDSDMEALYLRAHKQGARLTNEWLGKSLPCNHRVTSYRVS